MAFRTDITEFPFKSKDRGVWYFIIDWKRKTRKEFTGVQDKRDLIPYLSKIISEKETENHELYGVWTGQYKTDIFVIPIEIAMQKIKEYFSTQ